MSLHSCGTIVERLKTGESLPTRHENPYLEETLKYSGILLTKSEIEAGFDSAFNNNNNALIIEIGSYMGKNLLEFGEEVKNANFFGLEITYKRAVKCARKVVKNSLQNVLVGIVSDREFFPLMKDSSLHGVCLFFPDPWPKKKHAKNRIIREELFNQLKRTIKPGGFLWFKTDHEPYMIRAIELANEMGINVSEENEQPKILSSKPYTTNFEGIFTEQGLPIYRRVFTFNS